MTKQELASKIWATANELRKNIKASEYKDYILGFMFYKYLSDNELNTLKEYNGSIKDLENPTEDTISCIKNSIGYYIEYKDLFSVWREKKEMLGAKDVTEAIDRFYANVGGSGPNGLRPDHRLFDNIFSVLSSGLSKLGENAGSRDKAVRDIVDLINTIPPQSKDYDVLGYIYEYLIMKFSSEAKKDGAFYTPHGLTSLMAKIVAERLKGRKGMVTVYDPTVGTAGLLLNIGREVGKYISKDDIRYYGQELITETCNLAKMNLFMQGINIVNVRVRNGDTLKEDWPYFDEETSYETLPVDAVVSNPPYSQHWDPDAYKLDDRFRYGIAPDSKADLAFLLHCLYHVKDKDGVMAIVLPHGVLFRGSSEYTIRRNLVENRNIETIIGFPSNMFFSTSIPVIVMILSKGRKEDDILFIDASLSYAKEAKQNVLREMDIERIFDTVVSRKDRKNFARLVHIDEIRKNDYDLNIPQYISAAAEKIPADPYSVMTGEISEYALSWFADCFDSFPTLKNELFDCRNGYCRFKTDSVKDTVSANSDVRKYMDDLKSTVAKTRERLTELLLCEEVAPDVFDRIKRLIFEAYSPVRLLDVYSVYQAFCDEWSVIEVDINRIRSEGRGICRETEPNMVTVRNSDTKKYEEIQKGCRGKIIPIPIIQETYFADDIRKINETADRISELENEIEQLWDGLGDDERASLSDDNDEENTKPDSRKLSARAYEILASVTTPEISALLKYLEIKKKDEKAAFISSHPEIRWSDMKAGKDGSIGAAAVKAHISALKLKADIDIGGTEGQIVAILRKTDEKSSLGRLIKKLGNELEARAVVKLQSLTDKEIDELLTAKWIDPVIGSINESIAKVIDDLAGSLEEQRDMYAKTLPDIEREIKASENTLRGMLGELRGSETDIMAVELFGRGLFDGTEP